MVPASEPFRLIRAHHETSERRRACHDGMAPPQDVYSLFTDLEF